MNKLTFTRPDDWHLHLRDGDVLPDLVAHTARQFSRALVMPNLRPPVTQVAQALSYQSRIQEAASSAGYPEFQALMTLYLTDMTLPSEIEKAKEAGIIGVKLYPAGATTNSDAGVTDLNKCDATIAKMAELDIPLLVHGEVTHTAIDIFDREAAFIEQVLEPLRKKHPKLRVVFEHITTKHAADYVSQANTQDYGEIAATITAHHLLYNRNAIFLGGIRPHYYCLPVLKREEHRQALLAAATSDSTRFFLGTDSAPHAQHLKEHACGCAGCFTAPQAIELYAQAFDSVGKLQQLEKFASLNGPGFYGLPRNQSTITIEKIPQKIPLSYPMGQDLIVPLNAGESLEWSILG
ncbi:dihydroorotase [Polynucleobacter sp. SHI8]|uniref:dihydroorotase n=1 Tax=unclassified Polynucleobacter TaxID=2640945 RepID=UPI002490E295|nr:MULTISPECIES: dihydroorotase [unclassified Polynucleobacter]BDW12098.1 dihydroorotase [Polynucleobacter sp. SHI2]BDW14546.1 dihydroorotase [Polynucleobacter sp. SHI8]